MVEVKECSADMNFDIPVLMASSVATAFWWRNSRLCLIWEARRSVGELRRG